MSVQLDERMTMEELAQTKDVSKVAVVSGCVITPLVHQGPEGITLYVPTHADARRALKIWPSARFWGDFSDGTGIAGPLR